MLTVKLMNETYPTNNDLMNLINYVIGDHCACGLFGATGMMIGNRYDMYQAMINLKKEFCKTAGRQALHIIVSIDKEDSQWVTPQMALEMGYTLAASDKLKNTQTIFAVHNNTDKLHIHMVVNSVNYKSGVKVGLSVQQAHWDIGNEMNRVLNQYRQICDPNYREKSLEEQLLMI